MPFNSPRKSQGITKVPRSFTDKIFEAWFYSPETVWLGALGALFFQVSVTGISGSFAGFPHFWIWLLITGGQFLLLLGRRKWPLASFTGQACLVALSAMWFRAGPYCWLPLLVSLGSIILRSSTRNSLLAGISATFLSFIVAFSFEETDDFQLAFAIPVLATVAIVIALAAFLRWRQESLLARDRALLAEQETQAAVERQRNAERMSKVASELHDSVGHNLTGIITMTEGLMETPATAELDEEIEVINQLAREALEETRFAVRTIESPLHEVTVETHQSGKHRTWDDLSGVVEKVRMSGLTVVVTEHGKRVSDPYLTELAFLVIREALTNVMRHAVSATRVVVSLTFEAESLEVSIDDNGKQVESSSGSGMGLTAMAKRVKRAGGDVNTCSTANGWKLTAKIPY